MAPTELETYPRWAAAVVIASPLAIHYGLIGRIGFLVAFIIAMYTEVIRDGICDWWDWLD